MLEPDIEALPWEEQRRHDDRLYREQTGYLFAHSPFYRGRLAAAGLAAASDAGGLDDIARLPLTEKREIQASTTGENPYGSHLAVPLNEIVRVHSTSGSTGSPSYIPLTRRDLENWVTTSARSYSASGVRRGEGIVTTYNAGPFVAGAALAAFDRLGVNHIPMGNSSTERLVAAIQKLRPKAAVMTPSYATYIAEWAADHGFDLRHATVERLLVAGEPGGGEPSQRRRLEEAWGAKVTEAMGIGDIGPSLWGECEERCGMHLGGRGFVHAELIDPENGSSIPLADGARGELVLTHLSHQAAPLLRFRTRDHVQAWTSACGCGRTAPRVRCIGRTDDMLIVRGVNVFPSALREIVGEFMPGVSGVMVVRPAAPGVAQEPPLPLAVELARGAAATDGLAEGIAGRIRDKLTVTVRVDLVAFGSLQRSQYKSKLVEYQA
jgi:phenylacetate-CoA ligase